MGTPLLFAFALQTLAERDRSVFPFGPAPSRKRAVRGLRAKPAAGQSALLYNRSIYGAGKKVRSFITICDGLLCDARATFVAGSIADFLAGL